MFGSYYQQPYQNGYMMPYNANTQQQGITWVQGIAGAKSHPVQAGSSALLMDSESSCFYIKSVDASGMPLSLRVFDFVERTQQPQQQNTVVPTADYITREEFEKRLAELKGVQNEHIAE